MNRIITIAVLICSGVLFAEEVEETECNKTLPIWISASVDINSKYMWRGTIMNDRPVWQPCVCLGYKSEEYGGIYASVWSSMDLTHKRNVIGGNSRRNCGMQELDYYLGYTKSFDSLSIEIGHWWYTYLNDNYDPYNDLVLSAEYDFELVVPGAEVWWSYLDQDQMDNCFWFNFFLKRDFSFLDGAVVVTPKASLGFGDKNHTNNYLGERKVEFTDQTTELKVVYKVTENINIGARIAYTWLPSKTARDGRWMTYGHDGRKQMVHGGVSFGVSF